MSVEGAEVALVDDVGNLLAMYTTGSNGSYAFRGVKPSNYTLKAYAYGYNSTALRIAVEPYETSYINFSLVPSMLFLKLEIPSLIYSRGETMIFTIEVTNAEDKSLAAT